MPTIEEKTAKGGIPTEDKGIEVPIGGYKIFEPQSLQFNKAIWSTGFDECVAVLVHSKKTHTGYGMLCHLLRKQQDKEANNIQVKDKKSFPEMFEELDAQYPDGEWDVHLYGQGKPMPNNDILKPELLCKSVNWYDNRGNSAWDPQEVAYKPCDRTMTIYTKS
eukprot:gb/GFBE01073101.1/.p1 GENE.gb/GFBE01073101.1/~~gb/GFBE01073101.1/.p1  ORF type:complete len:163 (+),score=36.23 gb/GFBE01073101.1/:1-489(+)